MRTYRLYRRDPVKAGHWHYAVTCKGCKRPIYVLDDPTNGQRQAPAMTGDGKIGIPCLRCAVDEIYEVSDLFVAQSSENLAGGRPARVEISKSSRKPIEKAFPHAKAIFGVGYIEDRPRAASIVGRIITAWADIEVACARLLAELMGTNIPAAAAVFGSLRSGRAQHDALAAAASAVLDAKDLELFEAHMARRSSLEKERNDLAHGCFGVSVAIPDHIVWVSQADYLQFSAAAMHSEPDTEAFNKKQYVYELGTLERIAQEIEEFYHQLGSFRGYLFSRGTPGGATFRVERYPQLCSQPHIRQALDRIRTARKGAQAPHKGRP